MCSIHNISGHINGLQLCECVADGAPSSASTPGRAQVFDPSVALAPGAVQQPASIGGTPQV